MAYDAGMMSFVIREIGDAVIGGRIEKIYQPGRDEVVFAVRNNGKTERLLINAGSAMPHMNLTYEKAENPAVPPMFCMMLRKHLAGGKITAVTQLGFERAARFTVQSRDEMGFAAEKHIIVEIMSTFSNLIVTNENDKIISLLRPIDFSASYKRQLLPGMTYEPPPPQSKADPMTVTEDSFINAAAAAGDKICDKFIMSSFSGISPLVAREIAYLAAGDSSACVSGNEAKLWESFNRVFGSIKSGEGTPTLVSDPDGSPFEYSFIPLSQYTGQKKTSTYSTFGELIDSYFFEKSRAEKVRQRASDLLRIVSNAETRLMKKIALQRDELADCSEGERYKLWGDLIIANIYVLHRGDESAHLVNYYTGETMEIPLDKRLNPAANAQKYYKKYNKSKSAAIHLNEQIEKAEAELEYIHTVADALSRAESEKILAEIRDELYHSGYASKMKNYTERKKSVPAIAKYKTDGGFTLLCGRNNTANDHLTFKLAEKGDWWFHVKNMPGSHVVMVTEGREPAEEDFSQAAAVAAVNSKASGGAGVDVDYTLVRHVKKPAGSKPGYVIYHTNWSAHVVPDRELERRLSI